MSRKTSSSRPPGDSTLDKIRQDERPRSWPGYAAAVAAVAVATLARLALDPVLGDNDPFVTYFVATAAVAWFGRTGPAVVALALGGLITFYLFVPPRYALTATDPGVLLGMLLFLVVAGVIVAMSHAMRVARGRSERLLAEATARERALAEQAERLRTTLASIGDAVITTDTAGRVTNLNPVAEALTGWASAAAAGQPLDAVFRIVNEETRRAVENPAARALREGVVVGLANHTVLIAKDGSERPIDDSAAPIRCQDGEVLGCVLVFRDITDRHQAERSLRESEERAAFVRRAGGVGFWYCDLPFDVLQWDDLVKAHFWLPPDAPVTIDTFYARIHPHDRGPTRRAIEGSIRDRTGYDTEYRTVSPDTGAVKWVRAIGRTFYAADGTPTRFDGVTLDITDQKRGEEHLRESEERFRTLFETMDEGFCVIEFLDGPHGPLGDYVHVVANPAYAGNAGIPNIVGRKVREMVPDEAAAWVDTYRTVLLTGEPVRFQRELVATGRHLDLAAFRIGPPERRQVAVLFNDITARKRAEEAVRASEARNAFLVTLADTLRPLSDPTAVQAEASRVLGERLGADRVAYFEIRGDDYVVGPNYTRGVASIAGRYPVASFGPDVLAAHREGRTAVEADVDALPSRTADAKAAFAAIQVRSHVSVPLVKDGAFVAGLAVHAAGAREWTPAEVALVEETADRTWAAVERAKAEAALRASEEQRRLALDAAEAGAWNIDPATGTLTSDDRFRLIFSGSTAPLAYEQAFAAIHPDDRERVRDAVAAATRSDDPAPYAEEYRVVHPSGSTRWVLARGRANFVRTETGRRLASFDGTATDVTARKLIEDDLRRLAADLSEADRRKDEFLATLAHELRNPLAPIRNGLQVIRLAGATGQVEQARAMMDRQVTQLVRLVDDLLDVSRITRGKMDLRAERVDLRAVIDAALETSRTVVEQAGHELTVAVPDGPLPVDGDPTRLAQVVSNLLNNSAKYTHRGGHVRLAVRRDGGQVAISVADDGIGIPPAMLGRVFEMFTQVDRALEKTTGGLGIGLALVKGLVEMHGGTIEATSGGEGRGSEFVVRLPVAAGGGKTAAGGPVETAPSGTRRILVVDDNVDAADSLGQLLELLGNEVRTAHDGEAGVRAAGEFRPAVVLMDIGMPVLNGYEAARRIRDQPWGTGMVLVALTGWGQDDDRRKTADAGFDSHMVKPVEAAVLMKFLAGLPTAGDSDSGVPRPGLG